MSMVLALFDQQKASIVSDGHAVNYNSGVHPRVTRTDCRKVLRTRSGQIVGRAGQSDLCREFDARVQNFNGTLEDLAANVRQFIEQATPNPIPILLGEQIGVFSSILIGRDANGIIVAYDLSRQPDELVREQVWRCGSGERGFLAIGLTKQALAQLEIADREFAYVSDAAFSQFLRETLCDISRAHPREVGGDFFAEELDDVSYQYQVMDGLLHGRVLQTALTNNQPDLSKAGILNKHLGNISDDTPSGRFARTSVHSSHAPTTNPLTATDAGTNVTINIAANVMQVGATAVSNNPGSVTALSYSTLYYVYYDDPTLAGGAVGYQATTTKTTAINGAGRFFVGSIVTPKATAPNSNGNGDGGTGSQSGALYRFLFSATKDTSAGGSVTNPTNCIDGDPTTFTDLQTTGGGLFNATLTVSGAPGIITGRAQTVTLKLLSSATLAAGSGTFSVTVSYSLDNGNTFTTIYTTGASRTKQIDSIALPVFFNPGIVQIQAVVQTTATGTAHMDLDLYEAWIEIQE